MDSSKHPHQMATPFLQVIQLLDDQQVRVMEADRLKPMVPLRQTRYRRLSSLLNTAQQKRCTVRDVIDDLARDMTTSIEGALLLRDLWEVLRITEGRSGENVPQICLTVASLADKLEKTAFGGEEVLF